MCSDDDCGYCRKVLGQARLNLLVSHVYLISEAVGDFVGTCTVL